MFPEQDVEIPATFAQENVPDFIARHREEKDFPMKAENRKEWNRDRETTLRKVKSNYCAMVKNIDHCVGRMLDALEAQGALDNTVVVFTTDHGDLMGEHGMTGKNFLYEPAYRIPMLLRWPEKLKAGTQVDRMISTVDFMPTLLDLMDIEASGHEDGRSALPLLQGQEIAWDDIVFSHPFGYERVTCFTPEHHIGFDFQGEPILFDRKNDPDEVDNLYAQDAMAPVIKDLREKMDEHYATYCPRVKDWLPGQRGFDQAPAVRAATFKGNHG